MQLNLILKLALRKTKAIQECVEFLTVQLKLLKGNSEAVLVDQNRNEKRVKAEMLNAVVNKTKGIKEQRLKRDRVISLDCVLFLLRGRSVAAIHYLNLRLMNDIVSKVFIFLFLLYVYGMGP